ncbi:MAG: hypothetical protein ACI8XB_001961 [Patiriisocius sp.]|jgi:hypothetical protein
MNAINSKLMKAVESFVISLEPQTNKLRAVGDCPRSPQLYQQIKLQRKKHGA